MRKFMLFRGMKIEIKSISATKDMDRVADDPKMSKISAKHRGIGDAFA